MKKAVTWIMMLGLLSAIFSGTGLPVLASSAAPLNGKTVLFAGDSITYGCLDTSSSPRAWALRIQNNYGMTVTNKGQNGHSLSDVRDYTAYGNVDKRLHVKCFDDKEYDYVILQGGVNDIIGAENGKGHPNPGVAVAVGSIAATKDPTDFDTTTFAGGLERYFHLATTQYPSARIGFIITYQTPNAASRWGVTTAETAPYWQIAREICAKWGIPYLDLFDDQYSIRLLKANTNEYLQDTLHLNTKGYDIITPVIAQWMTTIKPYGSDTVSQPTAVRPSSTLSSRYSTSTRSSVSSELTTDTRHSVENTTGSTAALASDRNDNGSSSNASDKKAATKASASRTKKTQQGHDATKAGEKDTESSVVTSRTTSVTNTTEDNHQKSNRSWLIIAMIAASVVLLATGIIATVRGRV